MYQDKLQRNEKIASFDFWPYWFLQIVRKYRRNYSLKVHAQLEHGDVVVGWQNGGMNPELWNLDGIELLLGDAQPTHEEWRALSHENVFAEPQPIWLSELQASGLMVIMQDHPKLSRPRGVLLPMNRATYEAMGWMGRALANESFNEMRRN